MVTRFLEWLSHFRVGSQPTYEIKLKHTDKFFTTKITIKQTGNLIIDLENGSKLTASVIRSDNEEIQALLENEMIKVKFFHSPDTLSIWSDKYGRFDFSYKSSDLISAKSEKESFDNGGRILTSMPCKINQILVKQEDLVKIGTPLCVTEAMKMEVN